MLMLSGLGSPTYEQCVRACALPANRSDPSCQSNCDLIADARLCALDPQYCAGPADTTTTTTDNLPDALHTDNPPDAPVNWWRVGLMLVMGLSVGVTAAVVHRGAGHAA